MSACPAITGSNVTGLADALRAIDCRTGEATALAFGRLFGADGKLMPVLTILLTLYIAFFAIALLTGRARVGLPSLTPRMLTLGLVLTFATSWAAYQNTVWTMAAGAPDEVATLLAGTRTSATAQFAGALDGLFDAVSDAAQQASQPAPMTETGITPAAPTVGGFSASTVLWLAALMLLLGTVGVLVTAKIALAALLAIGPLFIVMALFAGTRGLFEGWLKAVVMFAVVPLFTVLLGSGAVAALSPVAHELALAGPPVSTRATTIMFVGAAVYLALMIMALKTASTIVSGWQLPFGARGDAGRSGAGAGTAGAPAAAGTQPLGGGGSLLVPATARGDDRIRSMLTALPAPPSAGGPTTTALGGGERVRTLVSHLSPVAAQLPATAARAVDYRTQAIGSRSPARPALASREKIS